MDVVQSLIDAQEDLPPADPDDWLYLDPPSLEADLERESAAFAAFDAAHPDLGDDDGGFDDANTADEPGLESRMAERVRSFLARDSGFSGAEPDARHSLEGIEDEDPVVVDTDAIAAALSAVLSPPTKEGGEEDGESETFEDALAAAMRDELATSSSLGETMFDPEKPFADSVLIQSFLESYAAQPPSQVGPVESLLRSMENA